MTFIASKKIFDNTDSSYLELVLEINHQNSLNLRRICHVLLLDNDLDMILAPHGVGPLITSCKLTYAFISIAPLIPITPISKQIQLCMEIKS